MTTEYAPGALISARGREWIVTRSHPPLLTLRPIAGGDETVIHTEVEDFAPAKFSPPDAIRDVGDYASARLLSDAIRLKLKDGAGAFRSMGRLSFEPRRYQYVPLLMAMQQAPARLLIADDVGIGKTVEAGMIAAELLARRDIERFAVLCPPHLCDQWRVELRDKFNLTVQPVTAALAPRLERDMPRGEKLFEHHPHTVVSLDFIKSDKRRHEFVQACPEFVIIDEAHTRIWRGGGHQQGYRLLKELAQDPDRHMIFLTATPHSGNDLGFFNLLALLNEEFSQLQTADGNARRRLRERLGFHFVQRMRDDIIRDDPQGNPFPERDSKEIPYIAENTAYGELLTDVLAFCRSALRQNDNRMTYWSMLALMRCVSSSPRAAEAALKNRMTPKTPPDGDFDEAEIKRHIMDGDEEDAGDSDLPPAILMGGGKSPAPPEEDATLSALAERATQIADSGDDPKLATLCKELDILLRNGKNPVIFCRYIATAKYVAEHLKKRHTTITVDAITGETPPTARAKQVEDLAAAPRHILVATDCLSEGINLQEYFDSVFHYDLSWNPTRHQQREGRVDRLGQRAKKVFARMLYGRDNPMDGAVLQVIIRKADKIRRELGVYVPLPDDAESMTEALLKAVLLRSDQPAQLSLFPRLQEAQAIENAWDKASDAARNKRRTLFAQSRIKPEDIIPETKDIVKKLGDGDTARRFVCAALRRRGISVGDGGGEAGDKITVRYDRHEHPDLEEWLPDGESALCFSLPAAPKTLYLHRAHPMVRHLAELFFESALLPEEPKYVHRAGAYFSRDAQQVTIIAVIRMRHQLHTTKKDIQLAEESAIVRIDGVSEPKFDEDEGALLLLDAEPAGNIAPGRRQIEVERAIERLEKMREPLNALARKRAQELREAHERVRRGVPRRGNITAIEKAETALPPDIIGVYVVLPYADDSAEN